jgi:hypothetical protein
MHPNPEGVDSAAKKRSKNFPRRFSRSEIANELIDESRGKERMLEQDAG